MGSTPIGSWRFRISSIIVVEFLDGAAVILLGQVLVDHLDEMGDRVGQLLFGDQVGLAGGKIFRVPAFEEPGGGPPVPGHLAGGLDGAEEVDFGRVFGPGHLVGELGVACGGAGDGARGAADIACGHPAAAAVGHQGDDHAAFGFVQT